MLSPYVVARQSIYWKFPGSSQRLAYVAGDSEVTKLAWQASDNSLWMLVSAPNVWIELRTGSSGEYIVQTADGAVGGHRVVKPTTSGKVGYADKDTANDKSIVLGITKNAASDLEDIEVQTSGKMNEVSWTWDMTAPVKPLYCGNTGNLTQTVPITGFICQVGIPLSPTSILIEVHQPIALN